MKVKRAVIWWLVNEKQHPSLKYKDMKIETLMPLVSHLFPGINSFSITGFYEVMQNLVIPLLRKRHPELLDAPAESIKPRMMIEVATALPCKKYEWLTSSRWRSRFEKILAA